METRQPKPVEICARLERRVIGQRRALEEMSVALAKNLAGLAATNILLIGSSGSGKTTLMRAVEEYLGELRPSPPVTRVHANVLGEEAERGRQGEAVLDRLVRRARSVLGPGATEADLLEAAQRGVVFVDEIDKIRTHVGGQPNVRGIRAQEALLTLMEGEVLEAELGALGAGSVGFDSSRLLFVAGGAFEGLYDAVYDRVTVGADRGALQPKTVVDGKAVRQEIDFDLREWLELEDLFDYGIGPQFLSRFESIVLMEELDESSLLRILLEVADAGYLQARAYFESYGIELALSPAAARLIASAARSRKRIGARALREIFHRIVRDFEFDPSRVEGVLTIDVDQVREALGEAQS